MNILQYTALIKTLERGTLSKAAEELGYTQSGLSRMINSLEEEMGIKVIERDRNGVRLTPEGEILVPYIRGVISAQSSLEQAAGKIKGMHLGLIRVGTFNSASAQWLPKIIKEFTDMYPDVKFELIHGTDEFVGSVDELKLDIRVHVREFLNDLGEPLGRCGIEGAYPDQSEMHALDLSGCLLQAALGGDDASYIGHEDLPFRCQPDAVSVAFYDLDSHLFLKAVNHSAEA